MKTIKRWGTALPLLVLGVALAVLPQTIFPACSPHAAEMLVNRVHGEETALPSHAPRNIMPCFFTARVVSGLGAVMALGGLLIAVSSAVAFKRGVSSLTLLTALLALATPHWLVGVCAMPAMTCRLGLTPAVNILSILIVLVSSVNTAWLFREKKGQPEGIKEPSAHGE